MKHLHVVDHPAVADRLARLRDRAAPTPVFRTLIEELGMFLAYEATRDLPLRDERVETPLMNVIDDAVVAHLGFYRDPQSLQPVPYYANVPPDLADRHVFLLDPMLATGNSGVAALDAMVDRGAKNLTFISVIAAPEGVATIHKAHPHVRIFTAALDAGLNDHAYIVPGLGDAGDRMFGSLTSVPVAVRQAK